MAAIYLQRSATRQYTKYAGCTNVQMTGQVAPYGGVTGDATTNVITATGLTAVDGTSFVFTNLAGGAGLSAGVKYYMVNSSGATFKAALTISGTAIDFTTAITSATSILTQTDDLMVWSSEFRDIFSGLGTQQGSAQPASSNTAATMGAPQGFGIGLDPTAALTPTNITQGSETTTIVVGTPKIFVSDDVNHVPLRVTHLPRSYWKFTMSTVPTTLWAEVMEGDILSDSPPNTP